MKMVKQTLYSFKEFLCVFSVGSFEHSVCYLLFDSVSDFFEIIAGLLFFKMKEETREKGQQEAAGKAGSEQVFENKKGDLASGFADLVWRLAHTHTHEHTKT